MGFQKPSKSYGATLNPAEGVCSWRCKAHFVSKNIKIVRCWI